MGRTERRFRAQLRGLGPPGAVRLKAAMAKKWGVQPSVENKSWKTVLRGLRLEEGSVVPPRSF